MEMKRIEKLLRDAALEGVIKCPKGHLLEPDNPQCQCGWKNPLVGAGLI